MIEEEGHYEGFKVVRLDYLPGTAVGHPSDDIIPLGPAKDRGELGGELLHPKDITVGNGPTAGSGGFQIYHRRIIAIAIDRSCPEQRSVELQRVPSQGRNVGGTFVGGAAAVRIGVVDCRLVLGHLVVGCLLALMVVSGRRGHSVGATISGLGRIRIISVVAGSIVGQGLGSGVVVVPVRSMCRLVFGWSIRRRAVWVSSGVLRRR
mmetsp:Transcript_19027/g.41169  ORF Transcript_19027/g.41169 Transcript_19027/m.41169 type:complete len:206 (+) Transcript_19027:1103-1720(+)